MFQVKMTCYYWDNEFEAELVKRDINADDLTGVVTFSARSRKTLEDFQRDYFNGEYFDEIIEVKE